jgi:hypothetical protein
MTGFYFFLLVLLFVAIFYGKPILARIQKDKLGKEKYDKLKNDFDAMKIMGEMNYIIDQIDEYWEQSEYFRVKPAESTVGKVFQEFRANRGQSNEEARMFKTTKKTLDEYIKKEWNPRMRILKENSMSYYSDKELRNAFAQFSNADREIQKLTVEGEGFQTFSRDLKVAGIGLVAATGLALGAVSAANSFGLKQSIRDNL